MMIVFRNSGSVVAVCGAVLISCCLPASSASDDSAPTDRLGQIRSWLNQGTTCIAPRPSQRGFWQRVAASSLFRNVLSQANGIRAQPIPELPDQLFLEYSRNGNRSNYQAVYFRKLDGLRTLVIAECIDQQGAYIDAISRLVRSYAHDKTWVLPAHDPKLENFEGRQITVDLFSSEVACDLASTDALLADQLAPDVRQTIRTEVERRVLKPYESLINTGKPAMWWITGTNNWNAVCLANVTSAALALRSDLDERAFYVAAAESHIRYFLRGFTAHGYCSEGVGYWNYGYGSFVRLAHLLQAATSGHLDLFQLPQARAAALFPRRIEINPGVYPAFADCSVGSQPSTNTMAYLSRVYQLPPTHRETAGFSRPRWLDEFGVYDFIFADPADASSPYSSPLRDWFADAGILVCRALPDGSQRRFSVALKGGHNGEHHNHNDLGSYVVAIDDTTVLADPGAEVYTRRTFSSHRYDSNVLNSFGHPVPRIAGRLQRPGRRAAAKVIAHSFSDNEDSYTIDLTSAYSVKSLQSLQRQFVFNRSAAQLTVVDTVSFNRPETFGTALITFLPWKQLAANQLQIGQGAHRVVVTIDSQEQPFTIRAEHIDEQVRGGRQPTRIGIDLASPQRRSTMSLTIQQ